MTKNTTPYQDIIDAELLNKEFRAEYLTALMEQDDPKALLVGLGNIAKATGMTEVSKSTGLNRENLYKMLSAEGNPEFLSLFSVLDALGLKLVLLEKENAVSSNNCN